ncbi:multiple inositol polyphosphate phosphatase 1-like isoform X2 [Papaver somniferum]|uniref:multiple inositol polyphosphate phosphatase 1-like isoform X2 n=1 Tax=Papaver somniferum TaxID=3469 RepID=UPI000E6F726D|nr:multiple inositol polyphosphate phosphatase 1-like isoform X2 [Papaver somniferum]
MTKFHFLVLIGMANFLWMFLCYVFLLKSDTVEGFDVRKHLSTVTSYAVGKELANDGFVSSSIPNGCTPIHLNLVARHGTRSPTKKRIRELDRLASHLEDLVNDAKDAAEKGKLALERVPAWIQGWQSPWKGRKKGGELISKGEDELYNLGIRIRERFGDLFSEEYHPDVFTIKATQVPRASASAVAFGMGLFAERGNLGPGKHRAFSVTSESHASDLLLRFFDTCETYKQYRKNQEPTVLKLKQPILDQISSALVSRYQLNFTTQDAASLWFLCKQEASLLEVTDQACGLFTPSEVSLLEWTDDLEVFMLKGYGKSVNYRMGLPLLRDVVDSMEQAIKAKEEHHVAGTFEKARLRFAHAETVVPFSCLLGIFLEGAELARLKHEQALELPPKPPQKRNWRGSVVAPFAGNNMLVLYNCPTKQTSKYYVQVMHNEVPVPLPGCDGSDFCSFEVFKEKIVNPHLQHNYNSVCSAKLEEPETLSFSRKSLGVHRQAY